MHRKLHNTLIALLASGSLLIIALVAGTPMPAADHAPQAQFASADAVDAIPAQAAERLAARKSRHSVRMPFFSFAPRS